MKTSPLLLAVLAVGVLLTLGALPLVPPGVLVALTAGLLVAVLLRRRRRRGDR